MDIRIFQEDEDPHAEVLEARPWRVQFITARAMWTHPILPTSALEKMSPEAIRRQKAIEAAGNITLSDDPDEALAEIAVTLIRHPEAAIHDADEVLIPAKEAELHLEYPLSVIAVIPIVARGEEITRADILNTIHDAYVEIYRREALVSRPKAPEDRGELLNRNATKGPFGIWGHDLDDLIVICLNIHKTKQGYLVVPEIES